MTRPRYYARKLCSVQPCSTNLPAINEIPSNKLDRVFQHSSEDMSELPDNSVAFMVTSPPYNVGKDYDQDLSLPEYPGLSETGIGRNLQGTCAWR